MKSKIHSTYYGKFSYRHQTLKLNYPLGLYRESSFWRGGVGEGGFEVPEAEFLAFKTASCNLEWKVCGQPINHRPKFAPPTVVNIIVPYPHKRPRSGSEM